MFHEKHPRHPTNADRVLAALRVRPVFRCEFSDIGYLPDLISQINEQIASGGWHIFGDYVDVMTRFGMTRQLRYTLKRPT